MGRIKDLVTGIEVDTEMAGQMGLSPVQYIVVDDEPLDIDEVNFQLQLEADEAMSLQSSQDAAGEPTSAYCDIHDAHYDPALDEWLETACDDPTCDYCVDRPQRPSLVVRKQQSEI